MNFANSRVITRGPNARLTRPVTDIVIDGIFAAKEIALKLKHQGATVIGCDVYGGIPTVQIVAGRFTEALLKEDVGVHWKSSTVSGVREKHGYARVFTDDGREVRLAWVERGH